ncbi:hypothetical protein [Haloferula sp. BvORR071]|uniref:hypothetical protein n=1 Tax=Haloferula sp. BvORR071 TaxID=1396141 RepID=UPI000550AC00|nr:hypothetical protein [Haloferula sp. BvORR071]
MNELTRQLLKVLWKGQPSFREIDARLAEECRTMSPPEAGVIGRDLILRKERLYTRTFRLAAWLASDGTAGNDGFMDFADCVAILPEERYQRIVENPDSLIDDEVSNNFREFYFASRVARVFDKAVLDEEAHFLYFLVLGLEEELPPRNAPWDDSDVAERFPRLYEKHGHLLTAPKPRRSGIGSSGDRVTLEDLIP